jgi:hypothetical protein
LQKSRTASFRPSLLVRLDHGVKQIFQLLHPLKHQRSLPMHVVPVFVVLERLQAISHPVALAPRSGRLIVQRLVSLTKDNLDLQEVSEGASRWQE